MSGFTPQKYISKIAAEREDMHQNDASGRQLTANTHETGLRGEFAFAEICGAHPDVSRRRTGDRGIDFVLPFFMTIDVKTRRERSGGLADTFLLVEEKKAFADIYVLAILSKDEKKCECVGWMKKEHIVKYPVKDLGTGVKNYQVPATDLYPMDSLTNRLVRWPKPDRFL